MTRFLTSPDDDADRPIGLDDETYAELVKARQLVRSCEPVSRWRLADAVRVLATGDGHDQFEAREIAKATGLTQQEIAATATTMSPGMTIILSIIGALTVVLIGSWAFAASSAGFDLTIVAPTAAQVLDPGFDLEATMAHAGGAQ